MLTAVFPFVFSLVVCMSRVNAQTTDYYVVPADSTSLCDNYPNGSCFILDQLSTVISSPTSNITVSFLPGSHTLTSILQVVGTRTHDIKFKSENETSLPAIHCGGTDAVSFRFDNVRAISIVGLAFHYCRQYYINGGALSISRVERATIDNCLFSDNRVVANWEILGGAVSVQNSLHLTITSSVFQYNYAICNGCKGGTLLVSNIETGVLYNTSFVNNSGYSGGAIAHESYSSLVINSSTFIGNTAHANGGAIFSQGGDVSIHDSTFAYNTAAGAGGAVYRQATGGTTTIEGCSFHHNNASGTLNRGGAISSIGGNVVTRNSTYTFNSAANSGGAIYNFEGDTTIESCSFTNNTTPHVNSSGGAVFSQLGHVTVSDSTYISNRAYSGGAMYTIQNTQVSVHSCTYSLNSAFSYESEGGGAMSSFADERLTIDSCNFDRNSASFRGGAFAFKGIGDATINFVDDTSSITVNSCIFDRNWASNGGALYSVLGRVSINNSSFMRNSANRCGAVGVDMTSVFQPDTVFAIRMSGSTYKNNTAAEDGGAVCTLHGNLLVDSCLFDSNQADYNSDGGAISAQYVVIKAIHSTFRFHSAWQGGVMGAFSAQMDIHSCLFESNSALRYDGGAIYSDTGDISVYDSWFVGNTAVHLGGAIYKYYRKRSSFTRFKAIGNMFINNTAEQGGALFLFVVDGEDAIIDNCTFEGNVGIGPASTGGALHTDLTSARLSNNTFRNNTAHIGAAIFQSEVTYIIDCHFSGNTAHEYGIIYAESTTVNLTSENFFSHNQGSVYVVNTLLLADSNSNVTLTGNTGVQGGAITCVRSQLQILSTSLVVIFDNEAAFGGGIYLRGSTLTVYGELDAFNNTATNEGGGVYSEQSEIECKYVYSGTITLSNRPVSQVCNNTASQNGGGLYLSESEMKITDHCKFSVMQNDAVQNGGGMYLKQSQIALFKGSPDSDEELSVASNTATKGGGVYISDVKEQCDNTGAVINECYIQTIEAYVDIRAAMWREYDPIYTQTFFYDNSASHSGDDVYGGLLDRCSLHPRAEILKYEKHIFTGLEYLLNIAKFEWANTTRPEGNITKYISSDPVQLCFCTLWDEIDCNYTHLIMYKMKGEPFPIRVIGLDQAGNPVQSTVVASFSSQTVISRLKEGQEYQQIGNQCTELTYNVYSVESEVSLLLYTDGPCQDAKTSRQNVRVSLLPCSCAVGLEDKTSPIAVDCFCDCDTRLSPYISHCSQANQTVQLDEDMWVDFTNNTEPDGFVVSNCPFDYCVKKPVNISLRSSEETDRQCAYYRTGVLCGKCEEGLSLVFASSKCIECSNTYLLLLIPFAVAGIALVVFILFLNMTVAEGTINGLILYANILAANRSIFLPFDSPNFLTVFISWLNLDFGIETCFYDGMDTYSKLLLQLAFPIYVFVLIGIVIVLSEKSSRFTNIISRRKPIATLCTLILLSYSKLLRITITSLKFSTLKYPDGTIEIVWLSDGNVPYFSVSHTPRFVIAFVIIMLGAVYTTLLLFGQVFDRTSDYLNEKKPKVAKLFTWVSHPKYTSFIREYHAPLSDKHRYWIGFLLLVRIVHILISSFSPNNVVILATGTIALGLIVFKLVNKDWQLEHTLIYKKWQLDVLETSFLLNITIVALFVQPSKSNQQILAYLSLAISFATFVGIVLFHLYSFELVRETVQKCYYRHRSIRQGDHDNMELLPQEAPDGSESSEEEYVDDIAPPGPYVYTDDNDRGQEDEAAEPQVSYRPGPIIRRAVPDDQLRAGADWMDDLLPVQPEDYNVPAARSRPRQNEMTTFTEVDIRPHRQ